MPFLLPIWAFAKAVPLWVWLAAALVAAVGVQTYRLDNAQEALAKSKAEVVALKASLATLGEQTALQNEAILTWKAKAEAQAKAAATAAKAAAKSLSAAKAAADAVKVEQVPRECPAALDWAVKEAQALGAEQ
jgi:hypothetical protein